MKQIICLSLYICTFSSLFSQSVVISEIDSDSPGTDTAEFIELYSSTPSFSLDGYVLVLFNGSDDASYASYDLDGFTTNSNGYFIVGDSGVTGASITLNSSGLQNGPDAVALYQANKSDFPNDTPVTTTNLIDAMVYDTNEADDTGLLIGLGETVQYNEDEAEDSANQSLQRQADGSFKVGTPSPSTINLVLGISEKQPFLVKIRPNPADNTLYIDGLNDNANVSIFNLTGQRVLQQEVWHSIDVSDLESGMYIIDIEHRGNTTRQKLIKK